MTTLKPKAVISQVRRETKKLSSQLKRNKNTLVSPRTIDLAVELSDSIKDDRLIAKQTRANLENNSKWPFPINNF